MDARIIHFGWDDCYRVQVLRSAGYDVTEPSTLEELAVCLQLGKQVDALVISEDERLTTSDNALNVFRSRTSAPVVLFRRSQHTVDESRYDKVFTCLTPPGVWLAATTMLIAQGRA